MNGPADDGQVAADGELPFVLVQVREEHHLERGYEVLTYTVDINSSYSYEIGPKLRELKPQGKMQEVGVTQHIVNH